MTKLSFFLADVVKAKGAYYYEEWTAALSSPRLVIKWVNEKYTFFFLQLPDKPHEAVRRNKVAVVSELELKMNHIT